MTKADRIRGVALTPQHVLKLFDDEVVTVDGVMITLPSPNDVAAEICRDPEIVDSPLEEALEAALLSWWNEVDTAVTALVEGQLEDDDEEGF